MTAEPAAFDLARLLRPRAIAIVGVSPEPGSIGSAVLSNLETFGYRGDIHLVSRSRSEIGGRRCLDAIDDLPKGVDVAVLAVPGAAVDDALAACARRAIGAVIVYAAGFAETGNLGAQEAMAAHVRAHGMMLNGPNCLGFVNFTDGVPLTYEPVTPQPDSRAGGPPAIGIVAQSGAMASSLRMSLHGKGLRVSCVISTGNEAVLGVEDFLGYLIDDGGTGPVIVFAEQIRQPARFLAIAQRARARHKPIVMLHPGRSRRARESARTHTGALAGDHAVMTTLIARQAVMLVDTIEELIDSAELMARFPSPPTLGTAVITNSGAFKGFALDFCESIGLDLPPLSSATGAALQQALPLYATIDNPLDTTGQTIKDPGIFRSSAEGLLADPRIGSAVVSIVPGSPRQAMAKLDALLPPLSASRKPVALAVMGDEVPLPGEFAATLRSHNVPFFRSPERALRAMAQVTAYGRRLAAASSPADAASPPVINPSRITWPRRGALAEYEGKAALAMLGIAVPRGALARSLEEAHTIAGEIGYPVTLKAQAPDLTHKSDVGGVILNVADMQALSAAWDQLARNVAGAKPDVALDGILVEAMAAPGLEMVVGARRDPDWGPVVMAGLGGVWIEALADVRLMPADLSAAEIATELAKLKGAVLLNGLRGEPPRDMDAIADCVARVGALMRAQREVVEVDINPLVVYPRGHGALALDAVLVTSDTTANQTSDVVPATAGTYTPQPIERTRRMDPPCRGDD